MPILFLLLVGGSAFYWWVENLDPVDAVYLSVMTLTTVGYGDVAPVTDAGKMFTSAFVIIGMGILVGFVATIAGQLRERSMLHAPLARLGAHGADAAGQELALADRQADATRAG
jgi:voltage-gated potassium channel Kch